MVGIDRYRKAYVLNDGGGGGGGSGGAFFVLHIEDTAIGEGARCRGIESRTGQATEGRGEA